MLCLQSLWQHMVMIKMAKRERMSDLAKSGAGSGGTSGKGKGKGKGKADGGVPDGYVSKDVHTAVLKANEELTQQLAAKGAEVESFRFANEGLEKKVTAAEDAAAETRTTVEAQYGVPLAEMDALRKKAGRVDGLDAKLKKYDGVGPVQVQELKLKAAKVDKLTARVKELETEYKGIPINQVQDYIKAFNEAPELEKSVGDYVIKVAGLEVALAEFGDLDPSDVRDSIEKLGYLEELFGVVVDKAAGEFRFDTPDAREAALQAAVEKGFPFTQNQLNEQDNYSRDDVIAIFATVREVLRQRLTKAIETKSSGAETLVYNSGEAEYQIVQK